MYVQGSTENQFTEWTPCRNITITITISTPQHIQNKTTPLAEDHTVAVEALDWRLESSRSENARVLLSARVLKYNSYLWVAVSIVSIVGSSSGRTSGRTDFEGML